MSDSTHNSHALDPDTTSKVPYKAQAKVPAGVEDKLPNNLHDTGNPDKDSHDKGHSFVPKKVAEALPTKVEQKVPDAVHDTSGRKSGLTEAGTERRV
ncbi:hypothetical protein PRZ48_010209 [Zasmidium cellare]|uniref:Uncharacterized protein n=1 Tax=Zasmidium cellare TaxID=395010 RepID=A0ABR0EEI3_ZASCE|nr:hypothetical protein PRZ48_010209 [Zasmidium cellare]